MPQLHDHGERMIPAYHAGTLVYSEHIARYRFAAQFVAGKAVLDVASGSGYGSELLALAGASRVVGIDNAVEAVAYSLDAHASGAPNFAVGDAVSLPLRSQSFDVIVSFETIEHVDEPERMIAELKRALKPGGLLAISTPNKGVYLEGNPFHSHEMTSEEFQQVLSRQFQNLQVFLQDNWMASAVLDETAMLSSDIQLTGGADVLKTAAREPASAVYSLAVCSDGPIPATNGQLTLGSPAEVERYVRELGEGRFALDKERREAQAETARLDAIIRARESTLSELNDRLRHQDEEVIDLTMRLNAIYSSPGYRILSGYRKVTRALFPPDSTRGAPYRFVMRGLRAVMRLGRRGSQLAARGSRARSKYGTTGVIKRSVQAVRTTKTVDPLKYALAAKWNGEQAVDRPRERSADEPITINWLVPTIGEGGGLRTIFRFYEHLKSQGFRQRLYEMPVGRTRRARPEEVRNDAKRLFSVELDEVSLDFERMEDADIIFATSWHTAYPVFAHAGAGRRFYFVQDFEPYFAAVGTESVLAENTYRFGFHAITAGPWLAQKLSDEYGMRCDPFHLAVDSMVYYPKQSERSDKIFYYARPATPRRGYELGMQALEVFHARHPEYQIVLAGGEIPHGNWKFRPSNRGHVSEVQLNDLYNQSRAALVISLTNCSLLPLEILAAGCPVVTNDGPNNSMLLPKDSVVYAVPAPEALADALEQAIDVADRDLLVRAAREYRWEDQFRLVEQIIRDAVREPALA